MQRSEGGAIRSFEVDGVQALFGPQVGPTRAGLMFRVGRADETLAARGITHMVEHLALFPLGVTDYHANGTTDDVFTHFYVQGSPDTAVDFLRDVCRSLTRLPVQRLETEKAILRAEEAGRVRGLGGRLAAWRYGAQTFGLGGYDEWGIDSMGAEALADWSRQWFTRENAVLWLTGEAIPEGLTLNLPAGTRRGTPEPTSALPMTPAYFRAPVAQVALDAVVTRSTAALVYTAVLNRALFQALRHEAGISYTAQASYEPRDADAAVVTAFADAAADKQSSVLASFVDVMERLRVGQFADEDVMAAKARTREQFDLPDVDAGRLPYTAMNELLGHKNLSVAELLAELDAVDTWSVQAVAKKVMKSALLQIPMDCSVDHPPFLPAPTWSVDAVSGRTCRARGDRHTAIVIGDEGVSLLCAAGMATVRYAECVAMLAWGDGGRDLIGRDGISVSVEPTLFAVDRKALATVDGAVDPCVVLARPARLPDQIPRPRSGLRGLRRVRQ